MHVVCAFVLVLLYSEVTHTTAVSRLRRPCHITTINSTTTLTTSRSTTLLQQHGGQRPISSQATTTANILTTTMRTPHSSITTLLDIR